MEATLIDLASQSDPTIWQLCTGGEVAQARIRTTTHGHPLCMEINGEALFRRSFAPGSSDQLCALALAACADLTNRGWIERPV
jgi:hypothetical protein